MLRIHLLNPELSRKITDNLKYGGVAISDVEAVSYMTTQSGPSSLWKQPFANAEERPTALAPSKR